MQNSEIRNMEFQLSWCETNLRYLYGSDQNDEEVKRNIAYMKNEIARLKAALNT